MGQCPETPELHQIVKLFAGFKTQRINYFFVPIIDFSHSSVSGLISVSLVKFNQFKPNGYLYRKILMYNVLIVYRFRDRMNCGNWMESDEIPTLDKRIYIFRKLIK